MKTFKQYEELFIEDFSKEFVKCGNVWMHESTKIPAIRVKENMLPALILKNEFPKVYQNVFNEWFDVIHPY